MMTSVQVVLVLFSLGLAVLYSVLNRSADQSNGNLEVRIIKSWDSTIKEPEDKFNHVYIGINANVDLIAPGIKVLEALGLQPGNARDHALISNIDELQEVFHYFFARGAAVERPYIDKESYKVIVQTAASLENSTWYIGGNAALMAQNIITKFRNCKVQLVGPVGPKLQQLLNPAVLVPSEDLISEDEVHLILEYSVGQRWGNSGAPVATRFITSYDESNGKATLLETFFTNLEKSDPDLVVFTGMHLLESQSEDLWNERIAVLKKSLKNLPRGLPVHLELASMVNAKFVSHLLQQTLSEVSSLGLNEQELSFASQTLGGPHGDLLSQGQPEIHKVTDTIHWILIKFGHSPNNPNSKLTRVHFHSLTFHIMGTVSSHWKNIYSAVAAGSRTAGQQACDVPSMSTEKFELKIPRRFKLSSKHEEIEIDGSNPVMTWNIDEMFSFAFSPVLVCKHPLKTVGLGDAISAVGLLYSQYIR